MSQVACDSHAGARCGEQQQMPDRPMTSAFVEAAGGTAQCLHDAVEPKPARSGSTVRPLAGGYDLTLPAAVKGSDGDAEVSAHPEADDTVKGVIACSAISDAHPVKVVPETLSRPIPVRRFDPTPPQAVARRTADTVQCERIVSAELGPTPSGNGMSLLP